MTTIHLMEIKNNENYDSVLVFESAIIIGGTNVYGLFYKSTRFAEENNRTYVEHIAGVRKWLDNDNSIDEEGNFVDKEGKIIYKDWSSIMIEYCKQAFKEKPIVYFFKEGLTFDYSEDDVDGGFIINKRVWDWAIGQIDELYDYGEDVYIEQDVKDLDDWSSIPINEDDDLEDYAWEYAVDEEYDDIIYELDLMAEYERDLLARYQDCWELFELDNKIENSDEDLPF